MCPCLPAGRFVTLHLISYEFTNYFKNIRPPFFVFAKKTGGKATNREPDNLSSYNILFIVHLTHIAYNFRHLSW